MDKVEKEKIVGIIRSESAESALESARAAIQGGIKLIEITLTVPDAYAVIGELTHEKDVLLAAGTVLNVEMAELAIQAGAKWVIFPHTDPEIISYCKYKHILVSPGALTPNEVYSAWNLGADIVKIFPIDSLGGPDYIRLLHGPMPFLKIMPTGSVQIDNFPDYLNAGATVVGIGSGLFDPNSIQKGEYNRIRENAEKIVARLN